MGVTMRAEKSFKGQEGMIRGGELFEVSRKARAEDLEAQKLAKVYVEEAQEENGDQEEEYSLEDILNGLNSHAKVDEFAKVNGFDIPSKDEAKMDERKAAIENLIIKNGK